MYLQTKNHATAVDPSLNPLAEYDSNDSKKYNL